MLQLCTPFVDRVGFIQFWYALVTIKKVDTIEFEDSGNQFKLLVIESLHKCTSIQIYCNFYAKVFQMNFNLYVKYKYGVYLHTDKYKKKVEKILIFLMTIHS